MKSLPLMSVAILLSSLWGIAAESIGNTEPAAPEATPQLKLDSAYLDLGTIRVDTVVEATLGFCNTGDAPLSIHRIFSDCGCTVPAYPHQPVAPGDSGKITVRFNSHNRPKGSFRKTLRIRSNGAEPRVSFIIKGRISAP